MVQIGILPLQSHIHHVWLFRNSLDCRAVFTPNISSLHVHVKGCERKQKTNAIYFARRKKYRKDVKFELLACLKVAWFFSSSGPETWFELQLIVYKHNWHNLLSITQLQGLINLDIIAGGKSKKSSGPTADPPPFSPFYCLVPEKFVSDCT